MNNSSAAFLAQQPQASQPAQSSAPQQPVSAPREQPAPETKTAAPHKVLVIPPYELMQQLSGLGVNTEFWYLTYMTHDPGFFTLRGKEEQNKPGYIRMLYNPICTTKEPFSRLARITKSAACHHNNVSDYEIGWFFKEDLLPTCPKNGCSDSYPFCIPLMQSYIEYHCQNNGMPVEEVYRNLLGPVYHPKPVLSNQDFSFIPKEEYSFINTTSAVAAEVLLRTQWVHLKEDSEHRISYVYVPCCEKSTRSLVPQALDFYRSRNGKHDFLRRDNAKQEICENRKCADCLFSQCPDKVAAYTLSLARKYGVNPLDLIHFILNANKINGVSIRGNYIFQERIHALQDIDFTPDSLEAFEKIFRYIVNHRSTEGSKAPLLPFHLAIYGRDVQVADKIANIFRDTVFYYDYIPCQPLVEYTFSEGGLSGLIDLIEKLDRPTVLHIKEMELLGSQTNAHTNHVMEMTKLNNLIRSKKSQLFVVVSGEKSKLDTALGAYSDFYHGTLHYKLTVVDMPTGRVVADILQTLQKEYTLEEGFQRQLEQYVISRYGETPLKGKAFSEMVSQTILFNHFNQNFDASNVLLVSDIPLAANRRTDDEIWRDMNDLTGLESVKDEIRSIQQLLLLQKKMTSLTSKSFQRPNMHMVFAGNPGTGKTTVARLVAEILYNLGFIRQNKLVETSPKDLVGQFVGQTAPKTAAVCESAYDGVLFIDEAYELTVRDHGATAQFRSECISELIKQMEDNRDRLVVILAGYTEEMRQLLASNAGFASRVGRVIHFEDYSDEQLMNIFENLVRKDGMQLHPDASQQVLQAIERAKTGQFFGNARYIRNLYESTIREHAKNTLQTDDPDELLEIRPQDIPYL